MEGQLVNALSMALSVIAALTSLVIWLVRQDRGK